MQNRWEKPGRKLNFQPNLIGTERNPMNLPVTVDHNQLLDVLLNVGLIHPVFIWGAPGIELLQDADDFPKDAPLLIITDGDCDRLTLYGRDHAYLIPRGRTLPFSPKGPVFYLD